MKYIYTEIEINAPASKVWEILTDFDKYPDWNPFLISLYGKPEPGKTFSVSIKPDGKKPMTFKPVCLKFERNSEFRWQGNLFFKGLFDGEHIFEMIEIEPNRTRFIHRENFSGILVSILWKQLDTNTRRGFEKMNEKLKERAEQSL